MKSLAKHTALVAAVVSVGVATLFVVEKNYQAALWAIMAAFWAMAVRETEKARDLWRRLSGDQEKFTDKLMKDNIMLIGVNRELMRDNVKLMNQIQGQGEEWKDSRDH